MKKEKNKKQDPALPEIKREKVKGTEKTSVFSETIAGKKHNLKETTFYEKEIEAKHLIKIAPLYYFCPDNNKVYMVPLSIQFSAKEFMESLAKASTGLANILSELEQNTPAPVNVKGSNEKN